MNGAEAGEEDKPKKTAAPPKKAPAAEKRVAEKKAPAKKRAPKKVSFLFLLILTSMPDTLRRILKSLARTLLMRSMKSQLMKMKKLRSLKPRSERYVWRRNPGQKATSHHRRLNSEPRRRQPSPSLYRKDQNRLRAVPRKLTQLMRKKIEFYFAFDNVSRSWLVTFCSPVAVCVLSSLICMLSYTVIIPNA